MGISKKASELLNNFEVDEYNYASASARRLFSDLDVSITQRDITRQRLIDHIAALESENTRLKERLRWVPVSERLPELDQDVLVMFSDGEIGCGQFRKRCNHNPYLDGADIRFYHHQKDRPYGLHPEYIAFWKYDSLPEVGE